MEMYREAVKFWVPITNGIRQTKSFTAYKLRDGLNYAQFWGLPAIETTQRSTTIPDDFREQIVVQLPEATGGPTGAQKEAPVQMIKHTTETEPPKLAFTNTHPNTSATNLGGGQSQY